ncbi:MAG: TatD family hydrolase [Alphaproteobacteria bacterium]|nr:TatD family hydrolase [Alphaproteobacteria bacterium]
MIVDSHCHLEPGPDTDAVIARAQDAGVGLILSVACAEAELPGLIELLNRYPMVYGAYGIHPEQAAAMPDADAFIAGVQSHPKIVGIGECGLDYHYGLETRDAQIQAFERQIDITHRLKKPLIIHTRDAEADTIAVLQNAQRAGRLAHGGVLHCFTGSVSLARTALDIGLHISASGIITFKKATDLRAVFAQVPLDRLLVETDAPYLAPLTHRGQANEPAFVAETLACLAELHRVFADEMAAVTTRNFKKLFQLQEDA